MVIISADLIPETNIEDITGGNLEEYEK